MRTIGGALDFSRLAELNRPTDAGTLAREAQKLAEQGLTPRDIGQALRVDVDAVKRLLKLAQAVNPSTHTRLGA